MGKSIDFYEILGVGIFASSEEIKAAYLKKIKQYHPDTSKGNKREAEEITSSLNQAYTLLKDKEKKQIYDEKYGFDKKREEIERERQAQKQRENKLLKKHKKNPPLKSYAPEQQVKSEFEETVEKNKQNSTEETKKVSVHFFSKKPKATIKQVKRVVLTEEQARDKMERKALDITIIVLLIVVVLLLIFK